MKWTGNGNEEARMLQRWQEADVRGLGRDPNARVDPADLVRCLAHRFAEPFDSQRDLLDRMRTSIGFLSLVAGSFVPSYVAIARQQLLFHGRRAVRPAGLLRALDSCTQVGEAMAFLQLVSELCQYPSGPLDEAHGRRRDPPPVDAITAWDGEDAASLWADPARRAMLPHIDSLSGLAANLQFIAMSIRRYDWNPRGIEIFRDGELLVRLPAGLQFAVELHPNLECDFIWSRSESGGVAPEVSEDSVHAIAYAGLVLLDEDGEVWYPGSHEGGVASVRVHSSAAAGLMAIVGGRNQRSRPLSWTEPAVVSMQEEDR